MISRRAFVLGAVTWPTIGQAHEGHSHMPLTVSADAVLRRGEVVITLTLFNSGHSAVTVFDVTAQGTVTVEFVPVTVKGGDVVDHEVVLRFSGDTPSIFTLLLDFGDRGNGPVVVML